MKIKRWFIFLIAACLLAPTVSAHGDNIETDGCAVSLPMTRSIDTTFDLDFGQASNWYINFDNEAGLFKFNHKYVDVFYDGFANADSSTIKPVVTIYLKEKVDGTYETVETKRAYPGNTYTFELPNGGTLTDYRLSFSCSKNAVCTFSVTSYK